MFTSTVDILPDGTATSAAFTPTQAGSYWWVAKFNGDPHNPAVSSACGDEHSVGEAGQPVACDHGNADREPARRGSL